MPDLPSVSDSTVLSTIPSTSSESDSWETASVEVFEGHEHWVYCICFYPDESKLVSGSGDTTLRIWDRRMGAVEILSGHTGMVEDVDVSRNGKMVGSGSEDKTVRIWNGDSGETMHDFEGHEDRVRSVQFSRDSSRIASGSDDATMRVWLVETGKLTFEPINVQIWNAETGIGILSIRNSLVTSLAWTADSTHIIGGGYGEVTAWNSHNGEQLRTWKTHSNTLISFSLSPAGTHLATCDRFDKTAFVFDVSTGEQIEILKHDQDVQGITYSPSARFIATACADKKVYLWEASQTEVRFALVGFT
ncbi:hypothetical protein PAXINDRAFT_89303, partial [Paxillus involutus ATCC 200175]